VVCRLKAILERFADALSCIDQCFIAHMGSFESRGVSDLHPVRSSELPGIGFAELGRLAPRCGPVSFPGLGLRNSVDF
jgi:hypothetical protein